MDNTTIWVLVIVAVIALLVIALWSLGSLIAGAAILLGWASSQGFIGVAVYFALWIFAFPFMLIVSIIIGLVTTWIAAKEVRKENQIEAWREKHLGNQTNEQTEPSDPEERRKWANRLPPYE